MAKCKMSPHPRQRGRHLGCAWHHISAHFSVHPTLHLNNFTFVARERPFAALASAAKG